MLEYISYAIFIMTVGMAAFGIMLSTYMRKEYQGGISSALIYYQVFVFAFGFYGLWGQAVFRIYIGELLKPEVSERISTVATLQGFPFLMLSWYMMIRLSRELTSRKTGSWFNTIYVSFSTLIFGSLLYLITRPGADPNSYYFIYYSVLCLISQAYAASQLLINRHSNKRIDKQKLRLPALLIIISAIIQIAILTFTDVTGYAALAFIFIFFLGHAGIAVLIRYSKVLKPLAIKQEFNGSFDAFCHDHEISPRESEIIMEICKGLTNKEISETLFISIQTVKDHTHRIYIKTGARNRVDLINRLKDTL